MKAGSKIAEKPCLARVSRHHFRPCASWSERPPDLMSQSWGSWASEAVAGIGGKEDLVAVLQGPADEKALGLVFDAELARGEQNSRAQPLDVIIHQLSGEALIIGGAGDDGKPLQRRRVAGQQFGPDPGKGWGGR
jgi:hypothetical protein